MEQVGPRSDSPPLGPPRVPLNGRLRRPERAASDESTAAPPYRLRFMAVDLRQQVQISSLLKLAGPFAASRWAVCENEAPDALVIGLNSEEGRTACEANRLDAMALPVLLLGAPEQARSYVTRDPASMLVLSPPFRHLSLYYCLDVLAQQCTELRSARANSGERCLRLTCYPPAFLLKADARHIRLASFLFAQPLSARELGELTGCDPFAVQRFLQACDRVGLIHVAAERRTTVPTREAAAAPLAPRLVSGLRHWLGL